MARKRTGSASSLEYIGMIVMGFAIGWLVGMSVAPVVAAVIAGVTGVAAALISAMSGLREGEHESTAPADETRRSTSRWRLSPWPLAMLTIGLLIGSVLGVWTRSHNILGTTESSEIEHWASVTGLPPQEIGRRLFELKYPYTASGVDAVWAQVGASRTITDAKNLETEIAIWENSGLERAAIVQRLFDLTYPSTSEPLSSAAGSSAPLAQPDPTQGVLYALQLPTDICERLLDLSEGRWRNELKASDYESLEKLTEIITDDITLARVVREVLCVPKQTP